MPELATTALLIAATAAVVTAANHRESDLRYAALAALFTAAADEYDLLNSGRES